MSRSSQLAALALVLAACESSRGPKDAGVQIVEAGANAIAVATPVDGAASAGPATAEDPCADHAEIVTGKSIGHTSVVFKIELAGGKKAAWKPNAKRGKGRYKGEIAAYRLATALGLSNVPPACMTITDRDEIVRALAANDAAAKLFAAEAIVEDGKVYGALIPWIDGLSFWPIEKDPLRADVRGWLTAGREIPPAKVDFARQASTLVAFDFMTGNWDRYSGENVGMDRKGEAILFIDNDAAFMEGPPKAELARNQSLALATDRFSRRFVARVRSLDEERLAAIFGEEGPSRPLLSRPIVSIVARRAKELVAIIDGKIAAHGEAETLYFP